MITMGKKGNSRHMKSLNAPRFFDIHRKENKYVTKPRAGRHTLDRAIPLALLLRKTTIAKSMDEAKRMLSVRSVKVNGKFVKDSKYAVGLNDIIEITSEGKYYKIDINAQGHIAPTPMEKPDSTILYKVLGKYKVKGNKLMLRLHDGSVVAGSARHQSQRFCIDRQQQEDSLTLEDRHGSKVQSHRRSARGNSRLDQRTRQGRHEQGQLCNNRREGRQQVQTLVRNIMVTK